MSLLSEEAINCDVTLLGENLALGKKRMSLQLGIASEIKIQSGLLRRELGIWRERTADPSSGMGIHRSQIKAVDDFLSDLITCHEEGLADLTRSLTSAEFAQKRRDIELQLTGMYGLAGVFQHILIQREERQIYRDILDVADLIAAECYLPCIERAYKWGALSAEQFRVPPLTYFNSMESPAAFTRRHTFAAFKMPIADLFNQKLPISVISLPFQYVTSIWMLCSIFHEVGHLIDQDLDLHAALLIALRDRLKTEGVDETRVIHWQWWLRELIADTFGILLGDSGFMYMMIRMLLRPDAEVTNIETIDSHPNHYVRICLLIELLRQVAEPTLTRTAWRQIEESVQQWRDLYGHPDNLAPYIDECVYVVDVLLNTTLDIRRNHRVRDLVSGIKRSQLQVNRLSDYFLLEYRQPNVSSIRLVPSAAQLAIQKVRAEYETSYASVQERALRYLQGFSRPTYLDGLVGEGEHQAYWKAVTRDSPERREYLRDLARNLAFDTNPNGFVIPHREEL